MGIFLIVLAICLSSAIIFLVYALIYTIKNITDFEWEVLLFFDFLFLYGIATFLISDIFVIKELINIYS